MSWHAGTYMDEVAIQFRGARVIARTMEDTSPHLQGKNAPKITTHLSKPTEGLLLPHDVRENPRNGYNCHTMPMKANTGLIILTTLT